MRKYFIILLILTSNFVFSQSVINVNSLTFGIYANTSVHYYNFDKLNNNFNSNLISPINNEQTI